LVVGGGGFHDNRDLGSQEILPSLRTLTYETKQTFKVGPAHTTEPPGHKPLAVNVVVVGPFEEEEEGIGITFDVVKVEDEDPDYTDTPGYLRGDRMRRDVSDPRSWVCPPWLRRDLS